MRVPLRSVATTALVLAVVASSIAFNHMSTLPGLIAMAPGYLVQAWLFERHWALGGAGYAVTLIGVSAIFWSLLLMVAAGAVHYLARRLFPGRAA